MSGIIINPYSFASAEAFSTKSLNFDGVDDIVHTNSTTIGVGGNCSLSFWVKGGPQKSTSLGDYLFSADYYNQWTLTMAKGADLVWWNINAVAHTLATDVFDDDWHHIVMIWNPSGADQTIRTYKDGALATNVTTDFRYAQADTRYHGPLQYIGSRPTFTGLDGNIDEVAMWHTELSVSDITAIYNSGTPGDLTSLSPVGWWRMGENSTFSSPQILMPEQSNKDKASNYSLNFDGVNDYVSISNGSAVNITGNGSISFWINAATLASYTGIVSKVENTASVVSNAQYHIGMLSNGVRCVITGTDLKIGSEDVGTVPTITTGVWEHYVLTWDGSNLSLYKNGVFAASKTQVSNPSTNTEPVLIGYRNGYDYVDGKIDEVSIFNTVLSAGDVTSMYNSGQPTDLTSLTPSAWWRMGEEAIFNSTNWLLPNKAQDVFSRYCLDFDGVSSYIDTSNATLVNGYTDVTFSGWINVSSLAAAYEGIICARGSDYILIHIGNIVGSTYTLYVQQTQSGQPATITYTLSLNFDSWYHFAIMGSVGGKWDMYINGSNAAQVQGPNTISGLTQTQSFKIGRDYASRELVGKIDEVSIFDEVKAIGDLWDGSGKPTDLTGESGIVSWWRMGEDATFSTNWTIPDKAGSNTGTSANMTNDDLTGDAPGVTANGVSANMTIEDRTGDAPDSSNNALSYNMVEADIEEEAP